MIYPPSVALKQETSYSLSSSSSCSHFTMDWSNWSWTDFIPAINVSEDQTALRMRLWLSMTGWERMTVNLNPAGVYAVHVTSNTGVSTHPCEANSQQSTCSIQPKEKLSKFWRCWTFSLGMWALHVLGRQHTHQEVSNFNCAKRLFMAHRGQPNPCRSTPKKLAPFRWEIAPFRREIAPFQKMIFCKNVSCFAKKVVLCCFGETDIKSNQKPIIG